MTRRQVSRPVMAFMCALALITFGLTGTGQEDVYQRARSRLVEEYLVKEGITNDAVLRAIRRVPRHLFVAPKYRPRAYQDDVLPIGYRQTISPPFIVGYMTETLDPRPSDRVLEIGTGSGYQAAVLAEIVKEVYTIEIVEPLGKQAEQRLLELGYKNVKIKIGDGYKGWAEYAPFDKIIVTCSPEHVPQPLIDQLKEGGRLIVPLGERHQQIFHLLEKEKGKLVVNKLVPTFFVAMTGAAEDSRKVKPDGIPKVVNGSFEKHTDLRPDGWYCKRQVIVSMTGAYEGGCYAKFFNEEAGRASSLFQGLSVDGAKIKSVRLSAMIRADDARIGDEPHEAPALSILFLDNMMHHLETHHIGPFVGTFKWKRYQKEFAVPKDTETAVIRIGLNGGVGVLGVDDVRIVPQFR